MGCGCKKRNEEQPIQSVPLTIKIEESAQTSQQDDLFSVKVDQTPPSENEEPQAQVKISGRIISFCPIFFLYLIYISVYIINMKTEQKLTSVNILDDVYKKFKIKSIEGSINLQKLVNRSMDLYNKDENFRNTINNHVGLATTGSKF